MSDRAFHAAPDAGRALDLRHHDGAAELAEAAVRAWCRRRRRASPARRSPRTSARSTPGASRAELIDATPIGINVRSTVATYTGIHAGLRYMAMAV